MDRLQKFNLIFYPCIEVKDIYVPPIIADTIGLFDMVMEHGPFDDKHDGPVHKAFRNGGKSAEFCATRHQALYEWETMRQLEEDTCHSDLVGVPPPSQADPQVTMVSTKSLS